MTLLRLCHIPDAWRNFIRLDIFLTSGGNFETLVGGNELCSSFFGSWERPWKMGAWLGWGGFAFKLQPNCSATKTHAALILVASLTNKMQFIEVGGPVYWHSVSQTPLGLLLPSMGFCSLLACSSSPACTEPSSRNSSKSHLRINSIINTFVGVRLKAML